MFWKRKNQSLERQVELLKQECDRIGQRVWLMQCEIHRVLAALVMTYKTPEFQQAYEAMKNTKPFELDSFEKIVASAVKFATVDGKDVGHVN